MQREQPPHPHPSRAERAEVPEPWGWACGAALHLSAAFSSPGARLSLSFLSVGTVVSFFFFASYKSTEAIRTPIFYARPACTAFQRTHLQHASWA